MTRKRCRRKVWLTGKGFDPVEHAISGAQYTPEKVLDKLRAVELSAVDAFASGVATMQDLQTMVDMVNLCEGMAHAGIGPEAHEACERAEAAVEYALRQFDADSRVGVDETGLKAFRDVYQYGDLQRQSVTRAQYENILTKTANRIRSRSPGTKVL